MRTSISCPICRVKDGYHKMDCQNDAYINNLTAELQREIDALNEVASLYRDGLALLEVKRLREGE